MRGDLPDFGVRPQCPSLSRGRGPGWGVHPHPPLTGGSNTSSSLSCSTRSPATYSSLIANLNGRGSPFSAGNLATSASHTRSGVLPSGTSTLTAGAPMASR